jgi:hypothetical protein
VEKIAPKKTPTMTQVDDDPDSLVTRSTHPRRREEEEVRRERRGRGGGGKSDGWLGVFLKTNDC